MLLLRSNFASDEFILTTLNNFDNYNPKNAIDNKLTSHLESLSNYILSLRIPIDLYIKFLTQLNIKKAYDYNTIITIFHG